MIFTIKEINHQKVAVVEKAGGMIEKEQDALDLMAEAGNSGARAVILHAENLPAEFFDLKTRLAGDILQKFSNYRMKLAIVGSFEGYQSDSLAAFMRESNRGSLVFFVPDQETAIRYLTRDVR
jgi:hypothetical protein